MADLARLYTFSNTPPNTNVIDADQVNAEFDQLIARINALEADSFDSAVAEKLGMSQTGAVRRGKSIVGTEQSRTNTAYGTLTTPDQVSNVVLPADGLLRVKFSALVKQSVQAAASVALFVGASQLRKPVSSGAPLADDGGIGVAVNDYEWVFTSDVLGSVFEVAAGAGNAARDTNPIKAGGFVEIEAPAGTYTVSVQFKASSGSVTAKDRKLWVEARGY